MRVVAKRVSMVVVSLAAVAAPLADVHVAQMPGADDSERLQNALNVALKTHEDVRLPVLLFIDRKVVISPPVGERFSEGVKVIGTGVFSSIRVSKEGRIIGEECKRVTFEGCGFLWMGEPRSGNALSFYATESASMINVRDCTFQGFDVALLFEGRGGADVSVTNVQDSVFTDNNVGVKYVGPNNLDPRLINCNFSHAKIGIDCRTGGSNVKAIACGLSYVEEGAVGNSGYQLTFDFTSAEGCRTVARAGGDDAGGYGGNTGAEFSVSDARDCPVPFVVNKSGSTYIKALKAQGTVQIENRSSTGGTVTLMGAAAKLIRAVKPGSLVTVKTF